jgi:hypothetical protein
MSGYLMAVTFKSGKTGTAQVELLGIEDGMYPNQTAAIAAAKVFVTAFWTVKDDGFAPTNMAALVSQTR